MIIVDHRRNTLEQLQATPPEFGIEVDLRNHGQDIIVTHDPFITDGVTLEEWLKHYNHRFLIANVKEEGMEERLRQLFGQRSIDDFFILDESFPFIRKWALQGESRFAVRVSEFESPQTALRLAANLAEQGKKVDWVWVDTFTGAPIEASVVAGLRAAGYKLCYVSPELHHIPDPTSWERRVASFINALDKSTEPDMICTKQTAQWLAVYHTNSRGNLKNHASN